MEQKKRHRLVTALSIYDVLSSKYAIAPSIRELSMYVVYIYTVFGCVCSGEIVNKTPRGLYTLRTMIVGVFYDADSLQGGGVGSDSLWGQRGNNRLTW